MKATEKIANHSFCDTYITDWYYYNEGIQGLNVSGDFSSAETDQTGFRHYKIYFCRVSDNVNGNIEDNFKDAVLKTISVSQDNGFYNVTLEISDEREHIMEFQCRDIHCQLLRYKGVSYKNVYGTKEYEELFAKVRYVKDEAYFKEQAGYELPDGYSLEVKSYVDMERKNANYRIVKAQFRECTLKHGQEIVYEYEEIGGHHVKPFTEFITHKNGHRYYPFHIDLYGISYLDIDTLDVYHYVPQGLDNEYGSFYGESFIITDIHYDADTNLIAYGGCYWASTCDVMVGDFSEPLHFNPKLVGLHNLLDPEYEQFDDLDFVRWEKDKLIVKMDSAKEYAVPVKEILRRFGNDKEGI